MGENVQAHLDAATRRLLARLRRQLGCNDSEIVRRAIRALADAELPRRGRPIIGVGEFESGCDNLGSEREHLDGFGR